MATYKERQTRTVLRTRNGVQVHHHPETVLATPTKHLKNISGARHEDACALNNQIYYILPTRSRQEWFSGPTFDCPEGNGQTGPVQTCPSNFCNVNLRL